MKNSNETVRCITGETNRRNESRYACIGGYDHEIEYRNESICRFR